MTRSPADRYSLSKSTSMELAIQLTDEQTARVQAMAAELGVQADELVRAAVAELLAGPSDSAMRFVQRILVEEADVYRRLA